MKIKLLAAALLFGTASSTHSSDAIVENVADIPAGFVWAGAYLGANLGYGWGNGDFVDSDAWNGIVGDRFGFDPDGAFGGIQARYNWQNGVVVVGAEAELGYLNLNGRGLHEDGISNDTFGYVDGRVYAGLSTRLGYAIDRTLLYTKGGAVYSAGKVGVEDSSATPPGLGTTVGSETIGWGYQVGAGVEHAVTDSWTVNLEYAYFDFGSETILTDGGFDYEANLSAHTLKVGIAYKF